MKTQWYLTFGAMALPIGFSLIILVATHIDGTIPQYLYYIGEGIGAIGIVSFFIALFRTRKEDNDTKINTEVFLEYARKQGIDVDKIKKLNKNKRKLNLKNFSHDKYLKKYAINLGMLLSNIRSIEVDIRNFLYMCENGYLATEVFGETLWCLVDGQEIEDNPFTDYANLEKLIDNYNEKILDTKYSFPNRLEIKNKNELIKLRDSFAHGRVFRSVASDKNVLLLVIFEKPEKVNIPGKTKVRFVKEMTINWLVEQITWTNREQSKIKEAEEIIKQLKP